MIYQKVYKDIYKLCNRHYIENMLLADYSSILRDASLADSFGDDELSLLLRAHAGTLTQILDYFQITPKQIFK